MHTGTDLTEQALSVKKTEELELEEAISVLLKQLQAVNRTETVSLLDAGGRVLAEDVYAAFPVPPFDRSPLDGYAFAAKATREASIERPVTLPVVGEICAGQVFTEEVMLGQAVRIMTGAQIPVGCDCVIRQEDVMAEAGQVTIAQTLQVHENYCFAGEDLKQGALVLTAGTTLQYLQIGVLASLGYSQVQVYQPPRVAICSTGDEITPVGQALQPGKIYNSNLYVLAQRLRELGALPVVLGQIPDEAGAVANIIAQHIDWVDLLITTGGVSVGKKDIIHDVIGVLGAERLFWRIRMKPGTPILAYRYRTKLCIGLSGNPFAAIATFELLVRPLLAHLGQNQKMGYQRTKAILADSFAKASKGRRFVRATFELSSGRVFLPAANHSSGALSGAFNCLIDIPAGTPSLVAGQEVAIVVL